MPKVSIIIPCYNQGQYIDGAVDSVLAQTFLDFEIIIVNDGSTEEFTKDILQGYNKPKTSIIHTKNKGGAAARNTGIKAAKGEIIVTLDADDKYEKTFLQKAFDILSSQKEVGIVSSYVQAFGESDSTYTYYQSGGVDKYVLYQNNTVACAMFRKKCWDEVGGYDEKMKNKYEDWDFWIRITDKGWQVKIIEEFLFFYRRHVSSMIHNANNNRISILKYLIQKNRNVFADNCLDAIISREEEINSLKDFYEKQIEKQNDIIRYQENQLMQYKKSKILKIYNSTLGSIFKSFK